MTWNDIKYCASNLNFKEATIITHFIHCDVNRAKGDTFSSVTLVGESWLMDEGSQRLYRLSFFRQGQLVDFNGGKVSDRSGLDAVWLLRGSTAAKDAAAGLVEAFTAEFGYFSTACLSRSRYICGASRKDSPLPAIPGGRSSRQGHRRRWAEATGDPPVVQVEGEGLAVTLSLTVTGTQVMMVRSGSRSQTVSSE